MEIKEVFDILRGAGLSGELLVWATLAIMAARWLRQIADPVLSAWIRRLSCHKTTPPDLINSNYMDRAEYIQDELRVLMGDLTSDRAYIFEFHNGDRNPCGDHFAKCSCTHEVTRPGIAPQMQMLQGLHVQFVHTFVKTIFRHQFAEFPNMTELEAMDPGLAMTLKKQGIMSTYSYGIFGRSGQILGFCGVDFCRSEMDLDKAQLDKIRETAIRIGMIMGCAPSGGTCKNPT